MRETRLDLESEVTPPFAVFRGAKVRLGLSDYTYSELGGAGAIVNTTFTNRAWEARLELPHVAVGKVIGTIGVQV